MRIVAAQELESWLTSGEVLEKDARGPKVVALASGLYLKIFHTRRNPLLARLQPAARRFEVNALHLQRSGIAVPKIVDLLWLDRAKGLSGCLYEPLPGTSLDQLFHQARLDFDALLPQLAAFIRQLHQCGIYFRSLHLGNILLLPGGGFGLIDFLDLRQQRAPLGPRLIKRNLEHLRSYLQRSRIKDFPWQELLRLYAQQPTN